MKALHELVAGTRWIRRVPLLLPLLLVVASASRPALAEGPEPTSSPEPQRVFGIGWAPGGGFDVASTGGATSTRAPALLLGTLEVQLFTPRGQSVDLSLPILNQIHGVDFMTDAFFNLNAGKGAFRLVAGPGLGFMVRETPSKSGGTEPTAWLRFPAEIGAEVLTPSRGFGVKVLARPYLDFAIGSGNDQAVGGGLLAVAGFSWYGTR